MAGLFLVHSMERIENDSAQLTQIPVRNWWLLLLYASQLYREVSGRSRYGVEEMPDEIPDILAEILVAAVQRRLRRNLTPAYMPRRAVLRRVRGRIAIYDTTRRRLLEQAKVSCSFEELTIDTPLNRLVKTALIRLPKILSRAALSTKCLSLAMTMERLGVANDPALTPRQIPRRAGRHNADDRRMAEAVRLIYEMVLLNEEAGSRHRFSVNREMKLWRLFEQGVAGFYDVVCGNEWKVSRQQCLHWQTDALSPGIEELLPQMRGDLTLENTKHRIIIDTKFNAIFDWHYEKSRLKSGHIYQIYTYLRSQEGTDALADTASGILLHPTIGEEVDEFAVIQGHKIRFATVDLTASATSIRQRLIHLIETQQ